jgi:hypothetical protein
MGLKQIKDEDRIVFLRLFVESMLYSGFRKEKSKQAVEEEKIRMKILEPFPEKVLIKKPEESAMLLSLISRDNEEEDISDSKDEEEEEETKDEEDSDKSESVAKKKMKRKIPIHLTRHSRKPIRRLKPRPAPVQNPGVSGVSIVNKLLKDRSIQSIECPGPGKNLIIKSRNKINVTRIVLNESQINEVMVYFSQQARIPISGGILKAAVGDLIVSAVSSKFIGSRFIINRETPYSLIGGAKPLPRS